MLTRENSGGLQKVFDGGNCYGLLVRWSCPGCCAGAGVGWVRRRGGGLALVRRCWPRLRSDQRRWGQSCRNCKRTRRRRGCSRAELRRSWTLLWSPRWRSRLRLRDGSWLAGGGGGVRGLPTIWQAPHGPGAGAPEEAVASR